MDSLTFLWGTNFDFKFKKNVNVLIENFSVFKSLRVVGLYF